jgi:branched-subunit amino acid transport protein AzlD
MIVLFYISLYILNVFLNRWLNYLLFKKGISIIPIFWFVPIFMTVAMIAMLIINYLSKIDINSKWFDRFLGKHWE